MRRCSFLWRLFYQGLLYKKMVKNEEADILGVCQNLWLVLYHLCGCRYHVFVVSLCQILWSLLSRFVVLRW